MKYIIFVMLGLLVALCSCQSKQYDKISGDQIQVNAITLEVVANEIIKNEYNLSELLFELNNKTDVNSFVAEVNALSDRFEQIAKILDEKGPFPKDLRKTTLQKLMKHDKNMVKKLHVMPSGQISSESAKVIVPAVNRCISMSTMVMMKADIGIRSKDDE